MAMIYQHSIKEENKIQLMRQAKKLSHQGNY
jgi:hypothetical protein